MAADGLVMIATELSVHKPIKIVIHLPGKEIHTKAAGELGEAITHYFAVPTSCSTSLMSSFERSAVGPRSFQRPLPAF